MIDSCVLILVEGVNSGRDKIKEGGREGGNFDPGGKAVGAKNKILCYYYGNSTYPGS